MPADLLTTELAIGPLLPNASITVNHGIHYNGLAWAPNIVMPDRDSPIGVASVTSTQITFTNFGQAGASSNFFVELEITAQRDSSSTAVWYWQGGSSSGGGSADPVQVGGGVTNVYVSATTGTPTGAGTKVSPLDGPDSVLAKYAVFLFGNAASPFAAPQINVHYANSLNQWDDDLIYSATALASTYPVAQLWVWSDPSFAYAITHLGPQMVRAVGLSTGPTIVAAGVTKTISTPATTTKTRVTFGTSPGWTVNNLKGRYARFINTLNGNQVIFEAPISANAANSFDIDTVTIQTQLNADAAHMTVEICDAGAIITGTANNFGFFGLVVGGNIRSNANAHGAVQRIELQGCMPSEGVGFDRCVFFGGTSGYGSGYGFFNCVARVDMSGGQANGALVLLDGSTQVMSPNPDTVASPEDQAAGMELLVFQGLQLGIYLTAQTFSFPSLPFFYTAYGNVSSYDVGNAAIEVGLNCIFRTNVSQQYPYNADLIAVQGSNNSTTGWDVYAGGLVVFDSPSANPGLITVSGTNGSMRVLPELSGTPNGIVYGTGAGNFEQAAGWNGNYTHILSATSPTTVILGSTARICTRGYAN